MVEQKVIKHEVKKTRNRSPEKKAEQFEKILEVGMQLFQKHGRDGFTTRRLAKKLGMNQNNLYNYVESKRELWIAIRKKYYEQYRNESLKLIKEFSGKTTDLLLKLFEHFFEFSEKDYAAFRMMHFLAAPPSNKVGPYEKDYKQFSFLDGTTRVIQKAIDKGEIKEKNAALLSFFMFSILLGAAMVEFAMRDIKKTNDKKRKELEERLQFGNQNFTIKDFRKYVLRKIQKGFSDPNLIIDETEYK